MYPKTRQILTFLEKQYDDMVTSAIRLSDKGKRLDFSFSLTAQTLKDATGHVRLRQEVVDYVLEFFKHMQVEAQWDKQSASFHISLNINNAAFTPSQARLLSDLWKPS
jgi:hypothetical protein